MFVFTTASTPCAASTALTLRPAALLRSLAKCVRALCARASSSLNSPPSKPPPLDAREPPFGAGSDPSNVVDVGYPVGSIQVPGGTEPIVLHRDAVSGGGYMMVGTVISADMDLIGQLQPHTATRFVEVDMPTALSARHDRENLLNKVRTALG